MPYYGEVPRSAVDPTDPLPFDTSCDDSWSLPIGAGVCAYDRDECTVTIALGTLDDVLWLVNNLPHRNRVKLCDDGPYGLAWLAEGFAPASVDTHPKGGDTTQIGASSPMGSAVPPAEAGDAQTPSGPSHD